MLIMQMLPGKNVKLIKVKLIIPTQCRQKKIMFFIQLLPEKEEKSNLKFSKLMVGIFSSFISTIASKTGIQILQVIKVHIIKVQAW